MRDAIWGPASLDFTTLAFAGSPRGAFTFIRDRHLSVTGQQSNSLCCLLRQRVPHPRAQHSSETFFCKTSTGEPLGTAIAAGQNGAQAAV